MKLVEFNNGTFGIRKNWFFGWWFADLRSQGFTWRRGGAYFTHCQGTREQAENYLKQLGKGQTHKVVQ